ncbi:MAG: CotH kinase family protein, partial [Thermoanaerobaculia bacterium]
ALQVEEIALDAGIPLLRPGTNVLALHLLNASKDDPDLLLLPELVAARTAENRYLSAPTPGGPNGPGLLGLVEDTSFSADRGFYGEPVTVEIATATEGAAIYYSLDGSEPGPGKAGSKLYAGPLSFSSTTTLRAAAFKDGFHPTNVDTQSYLFPEAAARQPRLPAGLPAQWNGFPADYEVDPEVVNSARPGYGFVEALFSIPAISIVLPREDLFGTAGGIYYHSSQVWERAASVELIDPSGGEGFQENAGVRIHGYTSRQHDFTPKHSFRVVFKSRFGVAKLDFPLIPGHAVREFNQFVLRGMSTDSWPVSDGWPGPGPEPLRWYREKAQYLREQWMKDSQADMGNGACHGRFVHLFLNGLYWGLYNLTERATDSFHASHFGGRREEYDVLKDFAEVHSGDAQAWSQMMGLAQAGLSSEAAYERIQGNNPGGTRNPAYPRYLDVDNLIDYMIVHIYAGADDWPNHNWWAGRRRGPESEGFRFFAWDQEITNNSLGRTNTSWGTRFEDVSAFNSPAYLYAQLRASPAFRLRFADRVHRHLFNGGALTPDANVERLLARAAEVD